MERTGGLYDIAIIGGGINGAAIARDAAGRGFRVLLVEKDDFAAHTSSASSKLIHGGVRYLEQYEFGLVRESLKERAILLKSAPHLVRALPFVMPHEDGMRPGWMIRAGLMLYDILSMGDGLPRARKVRLDDSPFGEGLANRDRNGFVYTDCTGDDSRLVIENLLDAARHGAHLKPRTELTKAQREKGKWRLDLHDHVTGQDHIATARALVNVSGPFALELAARIADAAPPPPLRLVKGSHIVVPRLHSGDHATVLQRPDGRIVFVIPYHDRFSLVGTTEVDSPPDALSPHLSVPEKQELFEAVQQGYGRNLTDSDIVWHFAGTRPLLASEDDARTASREYQIEVDNAEVPHITVVGGKLTTHRALAEKMTDLVSGLLKRMTKCRTAELSLPGAADLQQAPEAFAATLAHQHATVPPGYVALLVGRYGNFARHLLVGRDSTSSPQPEFGASLSPREVDWLMKNEWARTAEDIAWRRTKAGLDMSAADFANLEDYIRRHTAG